MSRTLRDAAFLRPDPAATSGNGPLFERLQFAFGPLAAGILLDIADFATFGPAGLFCGFLIGAPLGWWLASCHRLPFDWKVLCAVLAGVYCTVPFTEFVPLATLVTAFVRYHQSGQPTVSTMPTESPRVPTDAVEPTAE